MKVTHMKRYIQNLRGCEPGMVTAETALSQGPLWLGLIMAMVPLLMLITVADADQAAREIARDISIHGQVTQSEHIVERIEEAGGAVDIDVNGARLSVTVKPKPPTIVDRLGLDLASTQEAIIEP